MEYKGISLFSYNGQNTAIGFPKSIGEKNSDIEFEFSADYYQ